MEKTEINGRHKNSHFLRDPEVAVFLQRLKTPNVSVIYGLNYLADRDKQLFALLEKQIKRLQRSDYLKLCIDTNVKWVP